MELALVDRSKPSAWDQVVIPLEVFNLVNLAVECH